MCGVVWSHFGRFCNGKRARKGGREHFDIGNVAAVFRDTYTHIDPTIAVSYKLRDRGGEPNFVPVMLPHARGVFDLSCLSTEVSVDADVQYLFSPAAPPVCRIGSFTETMTPLTNEVPESPHLTECSPGILGCAAVRCCKPAAIDFFARLITRRVELGNAYKEAHSEGKGCYR